ncbi:MAG: hypothetical protein RLN76_09540 [Phycisphaeraceae bacterium]
MSQAGAAAGGAAAAQAAAIANAIKASGVIVQVEEASFMTLLDLADEPLVVHAEGGFFRKQHQYLFSVRGLAFYCKVDSAIRLPEHALLVESKKVWIPG